MRPCARACRSVLRIRTPLVQSGHAFATLHVAVCHLLLSLSLSLYTRAHKYNCKHTNTPTPPHPDTHPGKLADRQSAHSTDRHAPSTRAPSHHRETERKTDRDREGQRNREGERVCYAPSTRAPSHHPHPRHRQSQPKADPSAPPLPRGLQHDCLPLPPRYCSPPRTPPPQVMQSLPLVCAYGTRAVQGIWMP